MTSGQLRELEAALEKAETVLVDNDPAGTLPKLLQSEVNRILQLVTTERIRAEQRERSGVIPR